MRRGSVPRKRHRRGHCNRVPAQPVRAAKVAKIDDELRLRHHRPATRTAVPRRGLSEGSDVAQRLAKRPRATTRRGSVPATGASTAITPPRNSPAPPRSGSSTTNAAAVASPRRPQQPYRGACCSEGSDVVQSLAKNRAPRGGAAPCPGNAISGDTAITFHATRPRRADRKVDDELRLRHHRPVRTAVPRRGPSEGSEVAQNLAKRPRATMRRGSVTRKRHQRGHCNRVPAQPVRAAQIGEVDDELRLRQHRPRLP